MIIPPNINTSLVTNPNGDGKLSKKLRKVKLTLINVKIRDKNPTANNINPMSDRMALLFMSQ